jgi:hypothetical protein
MMYFIVNWGDAARISRAQGLLLSICIWARTLRTLYDWAKMGLLPLAPSVKLMYTFPHQDESAIALLMPPFGPVPPSYRGRRLRVPGRGDAPRHFHLSRAVALLNTAARLHHMESFRTILHSAWQSSCW